VAAFDQFVNYETPCKGQQDFQPDAFNWPAYLQASFGEMPTKGDAGARQAMEKLLSEEHPFDEAVARKYEDTPKFSDYALANGIRADERAQ
jgi:hypothetical protein